VSEQAARPSVVDAMLNAAQTGFVETIRQHAYDPAWVIGRGMTNICRCGFEAPVGLKEPRLIWAEHVAEVLGVILPDEVD
jgi:hypothetical protein